MENNNHTFNFAEKNNLKLSSKLEQKPNMRELADKKQISKAEQRVISYLKLEMPKLEITQQVVLVR